VQKYLQRNGGILEIKVHDIPGISLASGNDRDIERVLIFNCGVKGMGPRVKAWQHLAIDTSQQRTQWTHDFKLDGNPPGLKTTGLPVITDMAQFPNPAPPEGSAD
jgi:hypothetical protein